MTLGIHTTRKVIMLDNGRRYGWRKSTRSTANGQCVEVNLPGFKKAEGSANGACVEPNLTGCPDGHIHVRDSKDRGGPQLVFSPDSWNNFLTGIKADQLT